VQKQNDGLVAYRIEHLTKSYSRSGQKANDNLTLDIHAGEIFGLLGPNGAGKSTLVHQLSGLVRPTSGSILLFGLDVVKQPDLLPHYVSLQPQASTALLNLYPEEAIFFTGRLRGLTASATRQQTNALMEEFGLNPLRKKSIRTLSGGQQRLVCLAMAFVGTRPVQIFDEPTNELDPDRRRFIWDKLRSQKQQGTTVIVVTHNVLEAEHILDRVGIIKHGQLVALGTPAELKSSTDADVRIELSFKPEAHGYRHLLEQLGETQAITQHRWRVFCHRDHVQEALNSILTRLGPDQINDLHVLTSSLEDVYLQKEDRNCE
jgi:ABC-type multidrug transport system ATPase subunit